MKKGSTHSKQTKKRMMLSALGRKLSQESIIKRENTKRLKFKPKQFCKNGHDTFIYGRDEPGTCKKCTLIRATEWNGDNPKNRHKIQKKYRNKNDKKIKLQRKQWCKDNPEYFCYRGMIARCNNENNVGYKYYGGRGIKVCDRWLDPEHGYKNFLADIGPRPSMGHTIERKDVNGNYTPDNCKWATSDEQHRNKRSRITLNPDERDFIYFLRQNKVSLKDIYNKINLLNIREIINE